MAYVFNPDAHWQYIVIKETVTVIPWVAEGYIAEDSFECEAYSYDRTSTESDEEIEKVECGWVLRASQVPEHRFIVQNSLIVAANGEQWLISGEIKLLTKNSRYVCTGILSKTDLTDTSGVFSDDEQLITEIVSE